MLRVICMALMNVIPVVGDRLRRGLRVQRGLRHRLVHDVYLWISVLGNILAVIVIPFVGNLSDRIGRRPPIIVGALGSGCCRSAISTSSATTCRWRSSCRMLMWGVVYQGYNAVFPSFYPELFPTQTRVTGLAISQNIGTMITAFLPMIYAGLAPTAPGACVEEKKFMPDTLLPSGETCRAAADARRLGSPGRSAPSRSDSQSSRDSRRSRRARPPGST